MFWPPKFNSNNAVTLSDDKFTAENPGDGPRFDSFQQAACVLAPWMSWDGLDSRWPANDAMMRVLLIGEPSALLRSVNADGTGTILALGQIGAGIQRWEVVTYFDWYVDDDAGKVGAMAWCRLYVPAGGGGEEGGLTLGTFVPFDPDPFDEEGWTLDANTDADGIFCIMLLTDTDPASWATVQLDGVDMNFAGKRQFDPGTERWISIWWAPILSTDDGIFSIVPSSTTELEGCYVHVNAATVAVSDSQQSGSGSSPGLTSGSTAGIGSITIGFVACDNPTGAMAVDPDFTDGIGEESGGLANNRPSFRGPAGSVASPVLSMSSITADRWAAGMVIFS